MYGEQAKSLPESCLNFVSAIDKSQQGERAGAYTGLTKPGREGGGRGGEGNRILLKVRSELPH